MFKGDYRGGEGGDGCAGDIATLHLISGFVFRVVCGASDDTLAQGRTISVTVNFPFNINTGLSLLLRVRLFLSHLCICNRITLILCSYLPNFKHSKLFILLLYTCIFMEMFTRTIFFLWLCNVNSVFFF